MKHSQCAPCRCEWDAFESLISLKRAGFTPEQILFEVHLSKQYGIHDEGHVDRIRRVYDYLAEPDDQVCVEAGGGDGAGAGGTDRACEISI